MTPASPHTRWPPGLGPAGALPPVPSTPAHCSLPDRVPRGLSLCAGGQWEPLCPGRSARPQRSQVLLAHSSRACPPLGAADSPVHWVSCPQGPPGCPHICDFHMDRPLEESLLNPEPIQPFIPEGCDAGPVPLASAPWPPGPLIPLSSLMTSHSFPMATVGPYLALLPVSAQVRRQAVLELTR
nr:uncharacterized protein LOC108403702 isoform X3 [Manis javanica]